LLSTCPSWNSLHHCHLAITSQLLLHGARSHTVMETLNSDTITMSVWSMVYVYIYMSLLINRKIGKVYSLVHTEIPNVFFKPHHRHWCQQGDQGNYKGNNTIQQWLSFTLLQCVPTITSVHILIFMLLDIRREDKRLCTAWQ
jgi:hypothetical protein